ALIFGESGNHLLAEIGAQPSVQTFSQGAFDGQGAGFTDRLDRFLLLLYGGELNDGTGRFYLSRYIRGIPECFPGFQFGALCLGYGGTQCSAPQSGIFLGG